MWVRDGGRGHAGSVSATHAVALCASLSSPSSGYGNVAPKTPAGRLFCVFYGLFGVPLCLTWISALGKFFGGRAKRLGQFLTRRGVSLVCLHTLGAGQHWGDPVRGQMGGWERPRISRGTRADGKRAVAGTPVL